MPKRIFTGLLAAAAVTALVGTAWAAMITGTLKTVVKTTIDSYYIVKDATGKEYKLAYDDQTKKEGEIKEGANVIVEEARGHALSIKVVKQKPTEK